MVRSRVEGEGGLLDRKGCTPQPVVSCVVASPNPKSLPPLLLAGPCWAGRTQNNPEPCFLHPTCCRTLLTVCDDSHSLHYRAINGTTDVAIVTRASKKNQCPADGLCIVIEASAEVVGIYMYFTVACGAAGSCCRQVGWDAGAMLHPRVMEGMWVAGREEPALGQAVGLPRAWLWRDIAVVDIVTQVRRHVGTVKAVSCYRLHVSAGLVP